MGISFDHIIKKVSRKSAPVDSLHTIMMSYSSIHPSPNSHLHTHTHPSSTLAVPLTTNIKWVTNQPVIRTKRNNSLTKFGYSMVAIPANTGIPSLQNSPQHLQRDVQYGHRSNVYIFIWRSQLAVTILIRRVQGDLSCVLSATYPVFSKNLH